MFKTTEPVIAQRAEQPYLSIRTLASPDEMGGGLVPGLLDEVMAWMRAHGIQPSGAPLIRFNVIDMAHQLDIELGWPVAQKAAGEGRIMGGVLPAGRYASLIYTGAANGVAGNKVLIDWAKKAGLAWDRHDAATGDAFESRFEQFLTGPEEDPDMDNWDTEVAIKLADK